MWMNISCILFSCGQLRQNSDSVKTGVKTVLCPVQFSQRHGMRRGGSFKDGPRMCRVTAVSGGTLRIVVHGKAHGDVWISEMLQTDEIPREPTMDNVIPPQWCRNQMEKGAFTFLFLSFFYMSMNTHTGVYPDTHTERLYTPTHPHSLHTPV